MNHLQRIVRTLFRKKLTVIIIILFVVIIVLSIHHITVEYNKTNNVLLHDSSKDFLKSERDLNTSDKSNKDGKEKKDAQNKSTNLETTEELGIPNIYYNMKSPYIPKEKIVHFDLKGAPPKINYFKRILSLIKTMGATGILIEYEDMFPYEGILKSIRAKNAYSIEEINELITHASNLKLDIIPLVQTFGHVEFILKHKQWAPLREIPGSPQSLCPSRNSSLELISELITQVMAVHSKSKYLHIGCDEVFQMGECQQCRIELHETLFLRHIRNVAYIAHQKYPKLKLIIWDDMLRHLDQKSMIDMGLGNLVEPMVWVYAEDIYRFVGQPIWEKYGAVFKTAWAASAFKGAFGETLIVPNAKRHLENNLRWLEVMSQQTSTFRYGFRGISLTGWQRYDHFAVLCELLPAGLPSLALSLIAVSHGYFDATLKIPFLAALSCPQASPHSSPFINLNIDPHLWDKMGRCMFPGSPFFRITYRVHTSEIEVLEYLKMTKHHKGWLTEYNIRHNYSLPLRIEELTSDLPRIYHGLISLARSIVDTMTDAFDKFTISEFIEQKIYPYIIELEKLQNQSAILKIVDSWPARPLPPLESLQRLGIPIN